MKIYETQRQFVFLEEGMVAPEGAKIYDIPYSCDMGSHSRIPFPQYEFEIHVGGTYGWQHYFIFLYKGLRFNLKYSGDRDLFILFFLSKIKSRNVNEVFEEHLKETFGLEKYIKIQKILKDGMPLISILESNII